jgi:site-specific recombinase XerD
MLTATMTTDKNIYSFEQFLLVRRGLQPITIQGYCRTAKRFIEAVGTHYPTHAQVEDYVARFYRGGYSYNHVTNTSLGLERWMEFIENPILKYNNKYDGGTLRKLVRTLGERAAIKKRVYPQLLRHTLAVNMLMRGAGIYTIKEQLRHVFVDTTLIYLNSVHYNTRSEYDKYVPSYN